MPIVCCVEFLLTCAEVQAVEITQNVGTYGPLLTLDQKVENSQGIEIESNLRLLKL